MQKRILVDRPPEVAVGIGVDVALGRGGHAELVRGLEVFEDLTPRAFVLRAAPVAFVDDDEVEEVGRVLPVELPARLALHERFVDREENGRVRRHLVVALVDRLGRDAGERVFVKSAEVDQPLVGEDVAVSDEEDARRPRARTSVALRRLEVPPRLEELPRDLERDERLARAGGEREEDAPLPRRDRIGHAVDRQLLVVARPLHRVEPERHEGKRLDPSLAAAEPHERPQLLRRREFGHGIRPARREVDLKDFVPVRRIRHLHAQHAPVLERLLVSFDHLMLVALRLDHHEPPPAVAEDVVGAERLATHLPHAPRRDGLLHQHLAVVLLRPSRRPYRGIDQVQPRLRFVHSNGLITSLRSRVRQNVKNASRSPSQGVHCVARR